jgi:hypothetical protein
MEILDIIQNEDTLLLFFKEWTDLQKIIEKQKELEYEDKEKELNYYEIWISNFKFLGKEYPCIYLWFDYEVKTAIEEKIMILIINLI